MEDGDDTESNSIGNQAKIADAFLAECPDIQIVERYADNGYTGMNYNRPAFHQMMADVRSGKINCIIIKDCCAIIGLNQRDLENQGNLA